MAVPVHCSPIARNFRKHWIQDFSTEIFSPNRCNTKLESRGNFNKNDCVVLKILNFTETQLLCLAFEPHACMNGKEKPPFFRTCLAIGEKCSRTTITQHHVVMGASYWIGALVFKPPKYMYVWLYSEYSLCVVIEWDNTAIQETWPILMFVNTWKLTFLD
jgi:hypothetical protein